MTTDSITHPRLAVDADDVVAAAQGIGPLLRDRAAEAEAQRRPAGQAMDAMRDAGLFRLFAPRSLGGLEIDPVTCARAIEAVARFDSAAGWAIMVANSVDWWCSRLPDEGAEEIYADGPDAIIATAFQPPVGATAVDGGYQLDGRRPLASNAHDAAWLMLTAQVARADGDPEVLAAIFPAREAEIIDTWHSLGMRGTDSNDIAVDALFVPAARQLAQGKTPFGSGTVLRQRGVAQAKLGRAEAILRSARLLFYSTLEEAWERTLAGTPATLEQKADLALAGAHAVASAVKTADLVYSLAGTSGIYARSPLERHFRDAQTVRHHGFCSEARYETAGQVYLGVEPEFGFVAL